MANGRGFGSESVARELGRLSEAMENAKEDRLELRESFDRLRESVEQLSSRLSALDQTIRSTSAAVNTIALEKCGERLDRLEGKMARIEPLLADDQLPETKRTVDKWRKLIGQGWTMVGKLALAVIASGAISGGVFTVATKIAGYFISLIP